jgi:cytochrome c oxidase assembly protein subunit 15
MAAGVLNLATPAAPVAAALSSPAYRRLLVAATLLAFLVIGLGAYVRLSDAGLGCPDWPGCYGHLLGVPEAPQEHAAAAQAFPGKPVVAPKAWKEMIHRYAAGTLGLLIAALAIAAWRRPQARHQPPVLESALVGLIALQAALGMWTVTLLLKPAIVTAHLLGGMATFAVLVTLLLGDGTAASVTAWRASDTGTSARASAPGTLLRAHACAALAAVVLQIALGGWVSSNYAALACPDLPLCQGAWLPETDFGHAFTLTRALGETAAGALLPAAALTAIHLTHRLGALVVLLLVGSLAWRLYQQPPTRLLGRALAAALALQVGLGVGNVLLQLPLPLAVLHNLGAALLMAICLLVVSATRRA